MVSSDMNSIEHVSLILSQSVMGGRRGGWVGPCIFSFLKKIINQILKCTLYYLCSFGVSIKLLNYFFMLLQHDLLYLIYFFDSFIKFNI